MQRNRRQISNRKLIETITVGLLPIIGSPIFVSFRPNLGVRRRKLLSGPRPKGVPVYAASFIPKREIVLAAELRRDQRLLRLILVHELFHFVWPRLGNQTRAEYTGLLKREVSAGARGELGESAEVRKQFCAKSISAWKDYVCESFCDTAAWLFAGVADHEAFGLAVRWKTRRAFWFQKTFEGYWRLRCS